MTDPTPGYQHFFAELKRRRVFRVMAVYGIVGFVLLRIVDLVAPARAALPHAARSRSPVAART